MRARPRSNGTFGEPMIEMTRAQYEHVIGGLFWSPELNRDPTRTLDLRRRFAAAVAARFEEIKQVILTTVVTNDALRLGTGLRPILLQAQPARDFQFTSDPQKIQAFMDWLQQAVDDGVLALRRDEAGNIVGKAEWMQQFLNEAYGKGLTNADAAMRAMGIDVPSEPNAAGRAIHAVPAHIQKLEVIYIRSFNELKGVTDAMDQKISRTLADGLAKGYNPKRMGRALARDVENIGVARGRLIARTEVIRAHAEASLNRYAQFGLHMVQGKVEFATAADDRVCPICDDLDGETFTIDEARGVIPVHPSCRCSWVPAVTFIGDKTK